MERDEALQRVLSQRRATTRIAMALGVSRAAVSQWKQVPQQHLGLVAAIFGTTRQKLRPDLYAPPKPRKIKRRRRPAVKARGCNGHRAAAE